LLINLLKTWTNSNIWIVMGRNYQAVSTPQLTLEDIFSILSVSRQLPILKFPKQVLTQSLESADLIIH
jgi:hypothetical protein